jgi:LysR family transcriptional regulator, transcriptional activator for bauABCD operon
MSDRSIKWNVEQVDINLLRTFCTIVACGGFSAAQAQLNVSAAAISMKMAALENRLGMRLCQRGQAGFRLSEDGKGVYKYARRLFEAHGNFLAEVGSLKGHLAGQLTLAIIDATASNRDLKLDATIAAFSTHHPRVYLTLLVEEPSQIELQLLNGETQVGIAPFYHHVPHITYESLFYEPHSLYCGREHKFFSAAPDKLSRKEVVGSPIVSRGYVPISSPLYKKEQPSAATVYDMEAMIHLILSGHFIGYVPDHFAAPWVECGLMRPIRKDLFKHISHLEVAVRKGTENQRIISAFVTELKNVHSGYRAR